MKRIIAVLLALSLLLTLSGAALAEEESITSIDQSEVDELMDGIQNENEKDAYMSYARLCASLVSIMANDGYTLGHSPYALCYNTKKFSEDKDALAFVKSIVVMEDPWRLTSAQRSTTALSWSTLKSLRNTYINFKSYAELLNAAVAAKPAVPADCADLDAVITKACAAVSRLPAVV